VSSAGALAELIPYARFIGLRVERDETGLFCVLPFCDEIVGNARLPAVHGGVVGSFLEMTALLGLLDENRDGRIPKPINFSIDDLRSAGPADTLGRAEIVKLGRRIANVRVVAYQDDPSKPVAAGTGNFRL
jgi:acyl-coenzyme A thioesterase PaaI-like protein